MNEELKKIIDRRIKEFNLSKEQEAVLTLYFKVFYQQGYSDALQLIEKLIPVPKE